MPLPRAQYDTPFERRDVLGVHAQKQEGFSWVGACVPTGRLFPQDFYDFADVAEKCAPPPCLPLPAAGRSAGWLLAACAGPVYRTWDKYQPSPKNQKAALPGLQCGQVHAAI